MWKFCLRQQDLKKKAQLFWTLLGIIFHLFPQREGGGGGSLIVFTTGRGTPTGHALAPVLKVTGNRDTFERMHDNIDIGVCEIMEGTCTIEEAGERLLKEVIEVCNGKMTKAEAYGFSDIAVDHICRYI